MPKEGLGQRRLESLQPLVGTLAPLGKDQTGFDPGPPGWVAADQPSAQQGYLDGGRLLRGHSDLVRKLCLGKPVSRDPGQGHDLLQGQLERPLRASATAVPGSGRRPHGPASLRLVLERSELDSITHEEYEPFPLAESHTSRQGIALELVL